MTSTKQLPEYTPTAAVEPLPAAVAELARLLGRQTVRAYGAGDYALPGRVFEALANAPHQQTDQNVRTLAIQAGPWLEHPQFPGEFGRGYVDGAQAKTDFGPTTPALDTLSGVLGAAAPYRPRYPMPSIITAAAVTDLLAETLVQAYNRTDPDDTDRAAAREAQAHLVAVLEHLSTDPRVCQTSSTTNAVLKAARVLDRGNALYQRMSGELATG